MKWLKHLKTILKHRHAVIRHGFKAGIGFQSLFHDLSKFSFVEFSSGAKYFTDGKRSPNETERGVFGYSKAWLHHKGRNKHHFEYWTDYNPMERKIMPVKMPIKYVKEMFCDRVAASKIYQGKNYNNSHPYEYFIGGKGKRFIHPESSDLLEKWLLMLKEQGEKETFKEIKKTSSY